MAASYNPRPVDWSKYRPQVPDPRGWDPPLPTNVGRVVKAIQAANPTDKAVDFMVNKFVKPLHQELAVITKPVFDPFEAPKPCAAIDSAMDAPEIPNKWGAARWAVRDAMKVIVKYGFHRRPCEPWEESPTSFYDLFADDDGEPLLVD